MSDTTTLSTENIMADKRYGPSTQKVNSLPGKTTKQGMLIKDARLAVRTGSEPLQREPEKTS